ncbi:translation initiation factor [Flavobacteriaceae bacterium]|nr:translation initiation factor [Flavobacteriaceae bacterium]MDA9572381.1 translation initiation factor [Flavobacteriaceae bacterium]
MSKKLNSLEALAAIQFKNLAPDPEPQPETEPEFQPQDLEAHFSNKGRAGKTVTLIKGFEGSSAELKELAKKLKQAVGVGGSIKEGEIIIQGNYREQLIGILQEMGHRVKRIGG